MSLTDLTDVTRDVVDKFRANHQVVWYVTDETARVFSMIQAAAEQLTKMRTEQKADKPKVHIFMHDKLCGFYPDVPTMVTPPDESNTAVKAMQYMSLDQKSLKEVYPDLEELPFPVEESIIFVLRDWEAALNENPFAVQAIRDFAQSNMGSANFFKRGKQANSSRGKRLLVVLTSTDRIPLGIPEVKPVHVAMPDRAMIKTAVNSVVRPLWSIGRIGPKVDGTTPEALDAHIEEIVEASLGLTDQQVLDSVSLAMARYGNFKDVPGIIDVIEREKATHIGAIPGLTYISKDNITPASDMPGYETVIEFVRMCMAISPEEAAKRKVQRFRGAMLAGAPGTGKTTVGMAIASELKSILLIWNMGASQGEFVGQSERATQQVIQIANAMQATVLLDDVDKGGLRAASGGSETSMEGGPFGRMVNMLLTAMSSPNNKAKWIFTGNRIRNVPPELVRPGRVDERFFVQRPDEYTREKIATVHVAKRGFDVNEKMLGVLSDDEVTKGWTGAEIEALISKGVKWALYEKRKTLDFDWMITAAKNTTAMCDQDAYRDDIADMEKQCKDWEKCGLITRPGATSEKKSKAGGRTDRSVD
jgi:hypothetical protein